METVIAYSYLLILLVVSITGVFRYKEVQAGYMRSGIRLVWFSTLIEITSKFVVGPVMKNTLWLFNATIPVFFLLISAIYYEFFKEQIRIRQMIVIAYIIFLLFYTANVLWMQDFFGHIYHYSIAVMSLFVVLWSFFYFRHKMRQPPTEDLRRDPMFWISAGLLIFYGAQAFAMGSINYLNEIDIHTSSAVLSVVQVINITMNAMFLIAMLCQKSRTTFS